MAFDLRTQPLLLVVAAISFFLVATTVSGQEVPACVSSLIPCASYLNSTTTPPETCCAPLRDAAIKQTVCLCNLLNNKELLKTYNVDPSEGLRLAKNCNASVDATTCSKASAPSSTPSTSTPSEAASKSTPAGKSTNAAHKASWTAISGIMCLLFPLLWTIMA